MPKEAAPGSENVLDSFDVDAIDLEGMSEEQIAEALRQAKGSGAEEEFEEDDPNKGKATKNESTEDPKLLELQQQNAQLVDIVKRLAQGQGVQQQPRQQEQPRGVNFFGDMEEDDVPTVKQLNQTLGQFVAAMQNIMQQAVMPLTRPSYTETVTSYLPKALELEPELAQALESGNAGLVKYHVARLVQQLTAAQKDDGKGGGKPKEKAPAEDAQTLIQRIMQNAKKPGAPSEAAPASPLGRIAAIDTMEDADFGKLVEGVIAGSKTISRKK